MQEQPQKDKIEIKAADLAEPIQGLSEEIVAPSASVKAPLRNPDDLRPGKQKTKQPERPLLIPVALVMLATSFFVGELDIVRAQTIAAISSTFTPSLNASDPSILESQIGLAAVYAANNKPEKAIACYESVISKLEFAKQKTTLQVPFLKILLAKQYLLNGKSEKAESIWKEALLSLPDPRMLKPVDVPPGLTYALQELGGMYDRNQDQPPLLDSPNNALPLYEKAIQYWTLSCGKGTVSNLQAFLALIYEQQGNNLKAAENYMRAYNLYKGGGDTNYNAYRLAHIGKNLVELRRYTEAIPILQKGLSMSEKVSWWQYALISEYYLARAYFELGQFSNAKVYFEKVIKNEDKNNCSDFTNSARQYISRLKQIPASKL